MLTCPACRSADTQSLADRSQCLSCGAFIAPTGDETVGGLIWTSEVTHAAKETADATARDAKIQKKGK